MRLCASHATALKVWRSAQADVAIKKGNLARASLPRDFVPDLSADELRELCGTLGAKAPLDSLFGSESYRRMNKKVVAHESTRDMTLGEIMHIDYGFSNGLYTSSPYLALAQIAGEMSAKAFFGEDSLHDGEGLATAVLALYVSELAGKYRLDSGAVSGFRQSEPVCSIERLKSYMERCPAFRGKNILRKAADIAICSSASPMESVLGVMIRAPKTIGGMGIAVPPRANSQVAVISEGKKRTRLPDLLWEDARIDVEYNGGYHEGQRANDDDIRRNQLISQGYTVIVINAEQLFNERILEESLSLLVRCVGTVGRRPADYRKRNERMRAVLFEANGTCCRENRGVLLPERYSVPL